MNKKVIIYLTIMASFISAGFFSVNLGPYKLSVFRTLVAFILLKMFCELVIQKIKKPILNKSVKFSLIFMMFWFVYAILSAIWVYDFAGWIKSVYFIGLGFVLILIMLNYLVLKEDIVIAFRHVSVMIAAHNILGWFEVITGRYFFLSPEKISEYVRKGLPVTMFGNTNDYALFMFFSIFILVICWFNVKNQKEKYFYSILIPSSVILLILTGSRASILGMVIGTITLIVSILDRKKIKFLLFFIVFGMIILVFLTPNVFEGIQNQILMQFNFNFSRQDSSDYVRMNLIRNGLYFLFETKGFGTGAGNIEYWMVNYGRYNTEGIINIHNWWLEILVGYGVITFTLYLLFYIRLIVDFSRKIKADLSMLDKSLSFGITAMLVGFLVAAVGSSSNISSEWLWVVWSLIITYQGMKY